MLTNEIYVAEQDWVVSNSTYIVLSSGNARGYWPVEMSDGPGFSCQ